MKMKLALRNCPVKKSFIKVDKNREQTQRKSFEFEGKQEKKEKRLKERTRDIFVKGNIN